MSAISRVCAGCVLAGVLVWMVAIPVSALAVDGVPVATAAAAITASERAPELRTGQSVADWTPPPSVTVEYAPPSRADKQEKLRQHLWQRSAPGWEPALMQRKQLADGTVLIDLGGQGREYTTWAVQDGVGALRCSSRLEAVRPGQPQDFRLPVHARGSADGDRGGSHVRR
ncbi:MAG: hypothetical protein M0Q42_12195 [Xanthomonadales bacterium]|nr:hypothetical protein [Xanthomonadales bacterium]